MVSSALASSQRLLYELPQWSPTSAVEVLGLPGWQIRSERSGSEEVYQYGDRVSVESTCLGCVVDHIEASENFGQLLEQTVFDRVLTPCQYRIVYPTTVHNHPGSSDSPLMFRTSQCQTLDLGLERAARVLSLTTDGSIIRLTDLFSKDTSDLTLSGLPTSRDRLFGASPLGLEPPGTGGDRRSGD